MSRPHYLIYTLVGLFVFNFANAQTTSQQYLTNCMREQAQEHQGIKGKTLVAEDFSAYCTCQSEFIFKNASNQQLNSLVMNPKSKPDWLKNLESKAFKDCINSNPKIST